MTATAGRCRCWAFGRTRARSSSPSGVCSLADRGLTFGSNTRQGVCLRFHSPVHGGEPIGLVRHRGLTVTVADPAALIRRLQPYITKKGSLP
ncbi:hypothetical protein [Nonomuraea endophytica]|uniref:Uncharacterized protein n=1 Tax=Nonomuraea endophytica TaxID=714136 RepID=A0A7W8AH70_9ACTN|nr:hypothetical protein [Nonomuraea endophytica]MBB5085085.1 hypothetical protein [Nonomuraea endophytica]